MYFYYSFLKSLIEWLSLGFSTTTTPLVTTIIPTTQPTTGTCNSSVTTSYWPGGYASFLNIAVPYNVTNWTIGLTFTSPLSNLQVTLKMFYH